MAEEQKGFFDVPLWQKVLVAILLPAVAFWLLNSYIYAPRTKELKRLRRDLKDAEIEIKLHMPAGVVDIKDKKVLNALQKELETALRKIPREQEIPSLLKDFIYSAGKGLNITYKLIHPRPPVTEGQYKRVPLTVDLETDYYNLIAYLGQLEKLPVTIRVDHLNIKKESTSSALPIRLELSAFVLPQTYAKEPSEKIPYTKSIRSLFSPYYPPVKTTRRKVKAAAPVLLELQGFWQGETLKALIDGKFVGEGEYVSGFWVKTIRKDKKQVVVTRARDKKHFTITLKEE